MSAVQKYVSSSFMSKTSFVVRVGAGEIAARRVDDALGLSGGAGRVEDVEYVPGVHGLGFTRQLGVLHQRVIPVVAPLPA